MTRTFVNELEEGDMVLSYLSRIASEQPINVAIAVKYQRDGIDMIRRMKELEGFPSHMVTENLKTSVRFISGGRVVMSRVHENAFRGYSIKTLYVPSLRRLNLSDWKDFKDATLPTMMSVQNGEIIISL